MKTIEELAYEAYEANEELPTKYQIEDSYWIDWFKKGYTTALQLHGINKELKPHLKRLTDMNPDDLRDVLNEKGLSEKLCRDTISKLTSLYELYLLLGKYGDFDSYSKLQQKGFDVEFKLDRNGK